MSRQNRSEIRPARALAYEPPARIVVVNDKDQRGGHALSPPRLLDHLQLAEQVDGGTDSAEGVGSERTWSHSSWRGRT